MIEPSVIPLSLYIHWPWCLKKCPYCDFNSHGIRGPIPEEKFEQAIINAIKEQMPWAEGRRLESIFFGGGTPSLMSPSTVGHILEEAARTIPFAENIEITLEANPGTFEEKKFKDFSRAGINRLSIGIQSFEDAKLKALGRVHSAREAKEAASSAAKIFDNFNIDLMFGLPGQSVSDFQEDLQCAFSFSPTHLSLYQLTLEANTYFAKFPPKGLPEADTLSEMTDLAAESTASRGFDHYEVSAYSLVGRQCRHNLNYWRFGDYLAAGPGAHGKITSSLGIRRFFNYRDPARWLLSHSQGKSQIAKLSAVEQEALPFEFMLNALRLREGVEKTVFEERTGIAFREIESKWNALIKRGWVSSDPFWLKTTPKGWLFLNEVLEEFL